MAQALSAGETLRAEEIVLEVPDGGRVRTLVNATPIRSGDGEVESMVVTLQDLTPLEGVGPVAVRVPGDGQPRTADPVELDPGVGR